MSLAAEVDELHELCELAQGLRPEVNREVAAGRMGPFRIAHEETMRRIVQVCRVAVERSGET
jgi:hypothetical protein